MISVLRCAYIEGPAAGVWWGRSCRGRCGSRAVSSWACQAPTRDTTVALAGAPAAEAARHSATCSPVRHSRRLRTCLSSTLQHTNSHISKSLRSHCHLFLKSTVSKSLRYSDSIQCLQKEPNTTKSKPLEVICFIFKTDEVFTVLCLCSFSYI